MVNKQWGTAGYIVYHGPNVISATLKLPIMFNEFIGGVVTHNFKYAEEDGNNDTLCLYRIDTAKGISTNEIVIHYKDMASNKNYGAGFILCLGK